MKRAIWVVVMAAVGVLSSSRTLADDGERGMRPNSWDAPFSVELYSGAYGPVGGMGPAVMVTPTPSAVGWAFGGSGKTITRAQRSLPNEDGDELTPRRRR